MTANAAIAQLVDPEIYIPLAFSGTNCGFGCGEAGIIGIGLDPNGSDGYDDNLDIPAFPGAPGGDGRVIFNSDVIPLGLTRDVRQLGADAITIPTVSRTACRSAFCTAFSSDTADSAVAVTHIASWADAVAVVRIARKSTATMYLSWYVMPASLSSAFLRCVRGCRMAN